MTAFRSNFGVYLTAFLVLCITLDLWLAVMRPLQAYGSVRRARNPPPLHFPVSNHSILCRGARMEARAEETNLWTENPSGSGTQGETFRRNQTGWTDSLEAGNKDEGVGTAIAGSSIMTVSLLANVFVIAAITSKIRGEGRVSSVYFLIRHLSVGDILVSSLFLPVQMAWIKVDSLSRWTSWVTDDLICRMTAFLSNLGVYSTAFLVLCITLDRWLAVMRPLQAYRSVRRARKMALVAWAASMVCCGFERIVYNVNIHTLATWRKDCEFSELFGSWEADLAWLSMKSILVFGLPSLAILICYSCMVLKLWRLYSDCIRYNIGLDLLRRPNTTTLRLSLAIALLFVVCWAPYHVIVYWAASDAGFYFKVKPNVHVTIRLMACANSCLTPIAYGYYYVKE